MSRPLEAWARVQLRDVCHLINGRAYRQDELLEAGKYLVLRVGNFFSNRNWFYSDLELEPDKYCKEGDLLYAWSASFGPRIWEGGKTIFHYHIWKVRLNEGLLDKRFLYYWFDWDKKNIQADHGTGSTIIHVTKGDMENRPLALPPIPEQRRIVLKIDSLAAKSGRARYHLDHIPRLVEQYKAAVLSAAYHERLTADWRRQHALPPSPTVELGSIVSEIRYGTAAKCTVEKVGVPVLRIPNISAGTIDLSNLKYGTLDVREQRKLALQAGDLLVIRSNGSPDLVGRVAEVGEGAVGFAYAGYLIRLRVDRNILSSSYLRYMLSAPTTRTVIEVGARSTSGVHNINSVELARLRLPLPSLPEQFEIVHRIEAAFAWINRLAAEATSARKLVDRLDQTVLAKAFRGELVPQDPVDEPASVLLARIKAERVASPARSDRKSKAA